MKVVFSHPTGNQNSRNVAIGLMRNNMLSQFYTTVGVFSDSILQNFDFPIVNEIKRRTYDKSLRNKTTFRPYWEIRRLAAQILNLKGKLKEEENIFSARSIYKDLDDFISKDFLRFRPNSIYGYSGASMKSFLRAKENDIKTFYDLPGLYWRKNAEIIQIEQNNSPDWAETMMHHTYSISYKERHDKEVELSDKIFVASEFCKNSLNLFPGQLPEVKVIPYGFPPTCANRIYKKNKKLKILFVGQLAQYKGIGYLFDAVSEFDKFLDLTIIGNKPFSNHNKLNQQLAKHNYLGSLPHSKVLEVMRDCDLLVFPTLMDAFGMVITEAMSQGTPVITTKHSAGPELIKNGEDGWLVNAGNVEEIKIILASLLTKNVTSEIGINAMKTASRRTWLDYQNDVCRNLFING